jgi:hypothetical protein
MKRTSTPLAGATVLALGIMSWAAVGTDPARAEHDEWTLSLQLESSSFFLLDFRADGVREVTSFQDPFDPSRGDQTIFRDRLLRHGEPVGFSGGACTVTGIELADADPIKVNCVASYELPEGQITTQGLTTNNPIKRLPITGGTGRYSGAAGEGTFTENGDGTGSVVFRLTRPRR